MGVVRAEPAVASEHGGHALVPGDLESASAAARRRDGIPLTDDEAAFFARLEQISMERNP